MVADDLAQFRVVDIGSTEVYVVGNLVVQSSKKVSENPLDKPVFGEIKIDAGTDLVLEKGSIFQIGIMVVLLCPFVDMCGLKNRHHDESGNEHTARPQDESQVKGHPKNQGQAKEKEEVKHLEKEQLRQNEAVIFPFEKASLFVAPDSQEIRDKYPGKEGQAVQKPGVNVLVAQDAVPDFGERPKLKQGFSGGQVTVLSQNIGFGVVKDVVLYPPVAVGHAQEFHHVGEGLIHPGFAAQ